MAHIKDFLGEVLQKSLKVWVECDNFEALHTEMHVLYTSNLNTGKAYVISYREQDSSLWSLIKFSFAFELWFWKLKRKALWFGIVSQMR